MDWNDIRIEYNIPPAPYYLSSVSSCCAERFTAGDRVRIKSGYDGAGEVYYYIGKDANVAEDVVVNGEPFTPGDSTDEFPLTFLAAAIEPYPYSREERIERAIEDANDMLHREYGECFSPMRPVMHALMFALLDAGI